MPRTNNKIIYDLKNRLDRAALAALHDTKLSGRQKHSTSQFNDAGRSSGWNWYFYDFSTHNHSPRSVASAIPKSTKGDDGGSFLMSLLFFLLVTMFAVTAGFLFQNLRFRDWSLHGMKTYQNRWNRGTQLIQSVFEIAFSLTAGILALKFSQGLIAVLASLCGVSMAAIGTSFFLTFAVASLMLISFALGLIAGNTAVVSLIRWWSPLGTGRGFKRMHSDFKSSSALNEPSLRKMESGRVLQNLFVELSNRSPDEFRKALLDNKIDALRNLKCVINAVMEKQEKVQPTLESLSCKLSSLIHTLKNGVSDLSSLQTNLNEVRTHVSQLFGEQGLFGHKGDSHWTDFRYSVDLAITTLQHDVDRHIQQVDFPGHQKGHAPLNQQDSVGQQGRYKRQGRRNQQNCKSCCSCCPDAAGQHPGGFGNRVSLA